jgi:hypothetical protein
MDLEDECGAMAYSKSKSMKELDKFIKRIYEKYPE